MAVPSIVTNTGVAIGSSIELSSLSGTLLFSGKGLKNASDYTPNLVVFSGASLPVGDANGEITQIATRLQSAYSGSEFQKNPNIAPLLVTKPADLYFFGANVINLQLGGKANISNASTLVNGVCGGIPTNAVFFNDTASYSIANAIQ